jgi:uncharacterized membrane protein YphA (DoxX/SURF4 family)
MKTQRLLGISTLAFVALSGTTMAHEKWFYEGPEKPMRWDLYFQARPLGFTGGTLAVFGLACLVWRLRRGRDFIPGPESFGARPERRMAFYGLVPAILGLHLAVPLLVYGVTGDLFTPNNEMKPGWAHFFGLAEALIALCLFYGGMTRPASLVLIALWAAGAGLFSPEPMLESLHVLGYAGFFYLAGRGPIAVDRLLFPKLEPPVEYVAIAPTILRVGVGLSLVVVAFTEKLANLPLAESFLRLYPSINFTSTIRIGISDELFALCAGSVELLAGLLITFGVFPRTIILLALFPMNLSLTVFNWEELIGHMPFYGALAFLLVWSPKDRDLWVAGLRHGPLEVHETPG